MKALTAAVLLCFFGAVAAQTFNCTVFSSSCAKCFMAHPNCTYYWAGSGPYNTSLNGACVQKTRLQFLLYNNQYNYTVSAYALSEAEINSTLGQYKMSVYDSNLNYGAIAIPCYDRHLCYCKKPPPPPPSRYRVTVTNCLTGANIANATVALDANNTQLTGLSGATEFFPISPGTYTGSVSANGFVSKSLNATSILTNDTKTQSICLDPNPCTLQVITVLDAGSVALPGVSVVLGNSLGSGVTALASGVATFTFSLRADRADTIVGTIAGYFPASSTFNCPLQNGNAVVTLRFIPIPNQVNVEVRDNRTRALIPGATVSFTSFADRVATDGTSVYTDVAAGTYTLRGAATGYIANQTTVGPLTFNQTVTVVVFLSELPCGVLVTVLNLRNNAPIANASVTLGSASLIRGTTAVDGTVFFSILFDAANNATASKFGFNDGSNTFTPLCSRGANVTVTIFLEEVISLRIAARDVASPSRPFITSAAIQWEGQLLTRSDPAEPHFRILIVTNLPVSGVCLAKAKGFNDKTTTYTFPENGSRDLIVSLAPQDFTLYFVPQELTVTSAANANASAPLSVDYTGNIYSGYSELPPGGTAANVLRDPKPITLGGFAVQISQTNASRSFSPNTTIVSTTSTTPLPLNNSGGQTIFFAARFQNIVPTDINRFILSLSTDLDNMVVNRAIASNASAVVNVPAYTDIEERNLLYYIQYKLNAAFIMVRVFAVNVAKTALTFFSAQDFVTCNLSGNRFSNYNAIGEGGRQYSVVIFEFPTTFGENIDTITVSFPVETFSATLSGWADPDSPFSQFRTLPSGQESIVTRFSFNQQTLSSLFVDVPNAAGLKARDTSQKMYINKDYFVVALRKKRSL